MSTPWEFYLTPTLTLSLLLACETPPSLSSWFASALLYLSRPALLRQTLEWELEEREGATGTVSAGTLRVVDYARWKTTQAPSTSISRRNNGYTRLASAAPDTTIDNADEDEDDEDLSRLIASLEGIPVPSPAHDLLLSSLQTVRCTYALTAAAHARAATPFPEDGSADAQLRELWELLRPERTEWVGVRGKEWQEVGFHLDAFLYFARTYGERAAEMVDESVGGGEHWYPLALASIHTTAFVLNLAKSRDLQLYLLRALPSSPSASSDPPSLDPLLSLSADLLILFHTYWQSHQPRPTVMQFESVFRAFEAAVRPWVRRGVVDGRVFGWREEGEGAVKLE